MTRELTISSDSHVFEPPDLWTTRIDARFRERAPHIRRVDEKDRVYVERDQYISSIGFLLRAGVRFDAPETITSDGRIDDVPSGGYEPEEHLRDMSLDGVSGEVLYPSLGLSLFKVKDTELLSAIFRAYNDWLTDFCSYDPDRLKAIAMINLDDVEDAVDELQRAADMGMAGTMITEYPAEDRRFHNPEYEPFWAAADDLRMPLSMHTATRREGRVRSLGPATIQDASERSTKVFWPSRSLCDMIFSGAFDRHPNLKVAIVEFELAWAAHLLGTMDYTYIERQKEASYRFKSDTLPSDVFHENVYVSFQEDHIGIRLRDVIGVNTMMWGSDYPHSESTFPRSQEIIDEIFEGVSAEDKAKIVSTNAADLYGFDLDRIAKSKSI